MPNFARFVGMEYLLKISFAMVNSANTAETMHHDLYFWKSIYARQNGSIHIILCIVIKFALFFITTPCSACDYAANI